MTAVEFYIRYSVCTRADGPVPGDALQMHIAPPTDIQFPYYDVVVSTDAVSLSQIRILYRIENMCHRQHVYFMSMHVHLDGVNAVIQTNLTGHPMEYHTHPLPPEYWRTRG